MCLYKLTLISASSKEPHQYNPAARTIYRSKNTAKLKRLVTYFMSKRLISYNSFKMLLQSSDNEKQAKTKKNPVFSATEGHNLQAESALYLSQ